MKKIYKFNMVEIALAIAIIAIGLSAVLVLFPVGINATRSAMDENSSADVSEYVANFVRGKCLSHWKTTYEDWRSGSNNPLTSDLTFTSPSGLWAASKPETPENPDAPEKLNDITDYTVTTTDPKSGLRRIGAAGSGLFRFSRVTAEGEETFAALVKIWSDPNDIRNTGSATSAACPVYIPDAADGFAQKRIGELNLVLPNGTSVDAGHFAQSVLVEISWPTTAAEEDRTSRTFRVDVYNPYYTIRPDVTP